MRSESDSREPSTIMSKRIMTARKSGEAYIEPEGMSIFSSNNSQSNLVQQVDQVRFVLVDDHNLLGKLLIRVEQRRQAVFLG